MAETSGIAWTKSTNNFWIGCTKVSTQDAGGGGCDGCYAEHSTPARTMAIHWGPGQPRHRTAPQTWNNLDRWNKQAPGTEFAGSKGFWPVFVDSLSDFFDNEVPEQWRADAWAKMRACPNLTFLIVTKRIGNAKRMLPADWGDGYRNVWIIATVVNQPEFDRDVPKILALPAAVRGLSIEPQLGPINATRIDIDGHGEIYPLKGTTGCEDDDGIPLPDLPALDWVIVGGESDQPGHPAREFRLEWALQLAEECEEAGAAFFMKQLGHNPTFGYPEGRKRPPGITSKGEDLAEMPAPLRRREFPVARAPRALEVAC